MLPTSKPYLLAISLLLSFLIVNIKLQVAYALNVTLLNQFEDCVLTLDPADVIGDDLWKQPKCAQFQQNETFCNVGFGRHRHGNALPVGRFGHSNRDHTHGMCHYRGVKDRHSLYIKDEQKQEAVLIRFMEALANRGLKQVYILGDSVTNQLAHYVACDFLRSSVVQVDMCPGGYISLYSGDRYTGCNIIRHYNTALRATWNVTIISSRTDGPCHPNDPCYDPLTIEDKFHTYFAEMIAFHVRKKKDKDTLIVYNYGLHMTELLKNKDKHGQLIKVSDQFLGLVAHSVALGLLKYAQALAPGRNRLIFRETSAQHFPYSDKGQWDPTGIVNGTYCCASTHSGHADDKLYWADVWTLRALNAIDPQWQKILGWSKYYTYSKQQGEELHIESLSEGDCTHFIYNPQGGGKSLSNVLLDSVVDSLNELDHHH